MLVGIPAIAQPLYRFDGQYYPWNNVSAAYGEQFSGKDVVQLDGNIYTVGLHRTSLNKGAGDVFLGVHDVVSSNLIKLVGFNIPKAKDVKIIATRDDKLLIVAYTELSSSVVGAQTDDELYVLKIDQGLNHM